MGEIYKKSNERYSRSRDRCLESAFFCRFFPLIISILTMVIFSNFANAQKTNELAFEDLIGDFVASHPKKIDTVKGFLTENLKRRIYLKSKAPFHLNIDPPVVKFSSIGEKQFQRKISSVLTYQDSTEHTYALTYCDTLVGSQIPKVRKSKFSELRGTDPRWAAKFLFPASMIGIGIAGIISLFYIRSS